MRSALHAHLSNPSANSSPGEGLDPLTGYGLDPLTASRAGRSGAQDSSESDVKDVKHMQKCAINSNSLPLFRRYASLVKQMHVLHVEDDVAEKSSSDGGVDVTVSSKRQKTSNQLADLEGVDPTTSPQAVLPGQQVSQRSLQALEVLKQKLSMHSSSMELSGLVCGVACSQGWRNTMEDTFAISSAASKQANLSCFGVFDGHGGAEVARFAALHMAEEIQHACSVHQGDLQAACHSAFIALDEKLSQPSYAAQLMQLADSDATPNTYGRMGERYMGPEAGSTATVVLMADDEVTIAAVGDSRCLLGSDEHGGIALTRDHKASDPEEALRVNKAGAWVSRSGRVCGELDMSRALGDFEFKQTSGLAADQQAVIAVPQVRSLTLQRHHRYILLATDGLWNTMEDAVVHQFVTERLEAGLCPEIIAQQLCIEACISEHTAYDNVTVLLVKLPIRSEEPAVPEDHAVVQFADHCASEPHSDDSSLSTVNSSTSSQAFEAHETPSSSPAMVMVSGSLPRTLGSDYNLRRSYCGELGEIPELQPPAPGDIIAADGAAMTHANHPFTRMEPALKAAGLHEAMQGRHVPGSFPMAGKAMNGAPLTTIVLVDAGGGLLPCDKRVLGAEMRVPQHLLVDAMSEGSDAPLHAVGGEQQETGERQRIGGGLEAAAQAAQPVDAAAQGAAM